MIIGNFNKPKCFRGKSREEHGFDYHSNKKGRMNSGLFFESSMRFDAFIGKTNNRKVALLMENTSCHGDLETIPKLCNVEVVYFPSNTTSLLQPLDAEIISVLKWRYRKCQLMKALNFIEQNYDSVYEVDQITAMTWVQNIWQQLESTIIHNCRAKTGLIGISSANSNYFKILLPEKKMTY